VEFRVTAFGEGEALIAALGAAFEISFGAELGEVACCKVLAVSKRKFKY
jgi:hypothetical protein